jgi:hypothetical protein
MDFNKYYVDQATNSRYPVFRGMDVQRGYGLGGIFKKFFSWIMPIVREHALPVTKSIGKEMLKGAINVANDSLEGKNVKESAKSRTKEVLNTIKETQLGKGYKRKTKNKKLNKKHKKLKKHKDIFDF